MVGVTTAESFDEVVRREAASVSRYALSLTRNSHLAEDVVQETFLRAWRYWESFRGSSTRQAWLIRICRNVAFDMLKTQRNFLTLDSATASTLDESRPLVETTEELAALSLEHREVLVLVDLLGFDYISTAEILDCRVGTVRSRLSRARESYRRLARESA